MTIDHKKLALIHIVKKDLALTDEAYRDMLQAAAGVRSARDLDEAGFQKLMRFFARSGYYRVNPQRMTYRQKLYIQHLREDLGWDANHFVNFLRKYFHKTEMLTLSKQEASHLIDALQNVLKHQAEKA
jgi:phage gp16-like protein